jgi:hypothetical protein
MSARDTFDPTPDAGYTTAGSSPPAALIGQALAVVGESIYALLGGVWYDPTFLYRKL